MMEKPIPLFKIFWEEKDVESVSEVIRRGSHWTIGQSTKEFEKKIAKETCNRYALTFNSGTSALHASLLAHGVGPGDEVIVPSFTFIATVNAPLFVGARPVFADIENQSFGLDPESVLKVLGPKTKAIIPIHYGGGMCEIDQLSEIARENDLILIEDAAESLGARYKGKCAGTFGDSTVLSFCQNKVITTGEGGAVVTDSPEMAEMLGLVRSHGRSGDRAYFSGAKVDYVDMGFNWRVSEITASLGSSQMDNLSKVIEKRRQIASLYDDLLDEVDEVRPAGVGQNTKPVYQMYTIRIPEKRDMVKERLLKSQIGCKVYFEPVHDNSYHEGFAKVALPVTEKTSQEVLSLPIYPNLKEEEVRFVVKKIKNAVEI